MVVILLGISQFFVILMWEYVNNSDVLSMASLRGHYGVAALGSTGICCVAERGRDLIDYRVVTQVIDQRTNFRFCQFN